MYKIALLVYDYSLFGGAEKVALKLANEFVKDYEVHLISCFATNDTPIIQVDSSVKCYVLSKKLRSLTWEAIGISNRLKNHLIKSNIDLLISVTAGVNTIAVLGTRNTETKMIYAEHSNLLNKTYGKKHQFRQWIGAKVADYTVTLTEADKEQFIEKFGVEGRCKSIYNWYDGEIVSDFYDVNSQKIITVGRLAAVKGVDRLLMVAERVFEKYPTWKWDIYGEGPLREQVERAIKERKLENNVFLKGNRTDVIQLYKKYAFFVMTSYYEGLPLALLEAKSSLLPIISFDCPTGPSEIITDGYDGFLVENGNIERMTEQIIKLIEDAELRRKFSEHSAKKLEDFQKEKIAKQWITLINELCKEKGSD